ncbi:MAG TPA: HutD family protein [Jatrophihabitantaceae bacterium]|nr:HutD family protein [Jatrophihabitantaceae bacterium]
MSRRIVRWHSLQPEPWRNGGGQTRQVAVGAGWRVSIADIASDGPFSAFEGVDRVIMLIDGPAPQLHVGDRDVQLERFVPFAFDGGAPTAARRESSATPSRDLNLMTERATCTGEISVQPSGVLELRGDVTIAVVADGAAVVDGDELGPLDSVVCDGGGSIAVTGDATIAVCTVRYCR